MSRTPAATAARTSSAGLVFETAMRRTLSAVLPLRAAVGDESAGLDVSQHGEEAYVHAEGSAAVLVESGALELPALDRTPAVESLA